MVRWIDRKTGGIDGLSVVCVSTFRVKAQSTAKQPRRHTGGNSPFGLSLLN
jgi:hypothetical protein